jgi:hypothetical protein
VRRIQTSVLEESGSSDGSDSILDERNTKVGETSPKISGINSVTRGHIFSCVQSFYERAVSDLDRYMYISLWV